MLTDLLDPGSALNCDLLRILPYSPCADDSLDASLLNLLLRKLRVSSSKGCVRKRILLEKLVDTLMLSVPDDDGL